MADQIDHLFGTGLPVRQPASDALGAALLAGILADLSRLKEAVAQQATINNGWRDYATAQERTNAAFAESLHHAGDALRHQAESNAAQNVCNAEAAKLFDQFNAAIATVNRMADVLAEIDERLHAIDGKRSIRPAEEDTQ